MRPVLRVLAIIAAVFVSSPQQALAGSCEAPIYQQADLRPDSFRPSARNDADGPGWFLTSVLVILASLVSYLLGRPDRQAIKAGVGKVFTQRTNEADVHGRLPKLSKPLRATYNALVAELRKQNLWPDP